MFDVFSLKELSNAYKPFALSPIPNAIRRPKKSLLSKLTGIVKVPHLGLLTTSVAGSTDAAIVERSWGLISVTPSREDQFYGPNFAYRQFHRVDSWLYGMAIHYAIAILGFLVVTVPPFRSILRRFVYQPGQGPDTAAAKNEELEYRGVAKPDHESGKVAFARAYYSGSAYYGKLSNMFQCNRK
jgi:hypothetical protein